jgi:hypothetical protein
MAVRSPRTLQEPESEVVSDGDGGLGQQPGHLAGLEGETMPNLRITGLISG